MKFGPWSSFDLVGLTGFSKYFWNEGKALKTSLRSPYRGVGPRPRMDPWKNDQTEEILLWQFKRSVKDSNLWHTVENIYNRIIYYLTLLTQYSCPKCIRYWRYPIYLDYTVCRGWGEKKYTDVFKSRGKILGQSASKPWNKLFIIKFSHFKGI